MSTQGMEPKPPAVAMKETLDQIEATLATLLTHQQKQTDLGMLLADCRDTITEASGVMHSQTCDVLQRLAVLQQCFQSPQRGGRPVWQAWVCGGLVGALLVGAGWMVWPRSRYDQLAGALDVVLVQYYATLPKPVQEQLSTTYGRYGIWGPGQRQQGSGR